MGYKISEIWEISGDIERYENLRATIEQVQEYIQDWLESWLDSAREHSYKVISLQTDWKSYAKARIETDKWRNDRMILKVKKSNKK